ncbi:MAG: type II toxin-antitoxin system RelE/ParE family toxin [Elusimicrobiota bacterium]
MVLGKTPEFEKWLKGLDSKDQALVETRLESFEEGYFPKDDKSVGGKVTETRFMGRGLRVYYAKMKVQGRDIILLCGGGKGNKKVQQRDIKKAKALRANYE